MKRPSKLRYLLICLGTASAAMIWSAQDVAAQTTMPTFKVRDAAGEPTSPIRLEIEVPAELVRGGQPVRENSFVMLRGLPPEIVVSAGFRVKNAWVISFGDLDKVQLVAPVNYRGAFQLEVLLHWGKDLPPVTRQINVDIRPGADRVQTAAPVTGVTSAPPDDILTNPPALPKRTQQVTEAEESQLLARADKAMQLGHIAAARMIYENLAGRGSARAAYAMAQTYDPVVLLPTKTLGLTPDVEMARQWYRKAAELGSDKAMERLSIVGTPGK